MNNNNNLQAQSGAIARFLNTIERVGNKLPDPAIIFLVAMLLIWLLSWLFSGMTFDAIDPRTGEAIVVHNLLAGDSLATFLSSMVKTFTGFAPLGVVLVAMLGVGVAEHSGFINTGLKLMLKVTPKQLLTPSIILVAIVSHTATDAGYVLVIPLAGRPTLMAPAQSMSKASTASSPAIPSSSSINKSTNGSMHIHNTKLSS